jgi:hypothetical protein
MQIIGGILFLYGAAAFVMQYLEKGNPVVDWMGSWGANVGMGIRAAFVIIGIVLFILGRKSGKTATA